MITDNLSLDREVMLRRILNDPALFIPAVFGDELWPKQVEIARAVTKYSRVAIKSCNSSGKSFLLGRLVWWWNRRYKRGECCKVDRCPGGKVLITSAGWQQIKNIVGGEMRSAAANAILEMPTLKSNVEAMDDEGRATIIGISPKTPTRMQGHHAGHILIVVDEATGEDIPWDAIEGNLAGGQARLIMLGNPTVASGRFYDAFQGNSRFHTITIDAFDTPNLVDLPLDKLRKLPSDLTEDNEIFQNEPITGLTRKWWVYEMFHQFGETNPLWQSRVRGEFPDQVDEAVFPMAWLRDAQQRKPISNVERIRAGVDVAGPGTDESVAYMTRGGNILGFRSWRGEPSKQATFEYLNPYLADLEVVAVDYTGPGIYFVDDKGGLADLGLPVQKVTFGGSATRDDIYANRKAEIFWNARTLFRDGLVAGLVDEVTIRQLAGICYEEDEKGRIRIEPKEKARKRGVTSPDRAEALIMALSNTEPNILKFYRDRAQQQSTAPPDTPDPTRRPQPAPQKSVRETTYERTINRLTHAANVCNSCGEGIVGTRIEAGQFKFCKPCAIKKGML